MKIKILKTTKAATCARGIYTKEYLKDEDYEIFDDLANVFIKEGWGESVTDKKDDDIELEALRSKAKELKIKSSHMMGIDKLKEVIKLKEEELKLKEKALSPLENKAITNIKNKSS